MIDTITELQQRWGLGGQKPSKIILPSKPKTGPTFGVTVGICTHRTVYLPVMNTIRTLEKCPDPKIEIAMGVGDALISRSRSLLATTFLRDRSDEILWFQDDDVVGETKDLTRMMWQMQKMDLDILAAPYPLKTLVDAKFAVRTMDDHAEFVVGEGGLIEEMRYVSTGCMGIKRKVFEAMIKPDIDEYWLCKKVGETWEPVRRESMAIPLCHADSNPIYPFFTPTWYNLNDKWIYLSEDWAFCQRALDLGFKIWCDFSVKLEHIGQYSYTFDDFVNKREVIKGLNYKVDIQKE